MGEQFTLEIISPERSIVKTQTSEVVIPSFEGEMGILKNHSPLITFLRPGIIKIVETKLKKFFVEDGTVEFANNNLLILTSTAKDLSAFDQSTLNEIIEVAQKKIENNDISDKEKYLLSHKIESLKMLINNFLISLKVLSTFF